MVIRAICAILLGAGILLLPSAAQASSVIPLDDGELTISARVIVEGTVVRVTPAAGPDGVIYTYVEVAIQSTFKGTEPATRVVLKQPGGVVGNRGWLIFGSPRFAPGDKGFFFLSQNADGTLRVAHLFMGLLRVGDDERVLPSTAVASRGGEMTGRTYFRRDVDAFREDLQHAVLALGASAQPDTDHRPVAMVPDEYARFVERGSATPSYTLLGDGVRWFQNAQDDPIPIKVDGDPAPTPSKGVDESIDACAAWTRVPRAAVRLGYGGSARSGGLRENGVSVIAFGDPLQQLDDLVDCRGVLAQAAIVIQPNETQVVNGKRFRRIIEADMVVNNGIECLADPGFVLLREIITHELGHALGIGHSSDSLDEPDPRLVDATLYFRSHNDGRGASLRDDDVDALKFIYPAQQLELAIASEAVPDVRPNVEYSYTPRIQGGVKPFTYSVIAGRLPDGLGLTASGAISGKAIQPGTFNFTLQVIDGDGATATKDLVIRVTDNPVPFLDDGKYDESSRKLILTGWYLGRTASVVVNNVTVAPPKQLKYKMSKGQIILKGDRQSLQLVTGQPNVVRVVIGGISSNELAL